MPKRLTDLINEYKRKDITIPQVEVKPISKTLSQKAGYGVKASIGLTGNAIKKMAGIIFKIEW